MYKEEFEHGWTEGMVSSIPRVYYTLSPYSLCLVILTCDRDIDSGMMTYLRSPPISPPLGLSAKVFQCRQTYSVSPSCLQKIMHINIEATRGMVL